MWSQYWARHKASRILFVSKKHQRLITCISGVTLLLWLAWTLLPHNTRSNDLRISRQSSQPGKEAFGAQVIEVEHQNSKENINLLISVFLKADKDGDNKLSEDELIECIGSKIRQHIDQGVKENVFVFTAIDSNPRNGLVSWDEYHAYFLKQHGFSKTYADNHKENNHKELSRDLKEMIMRDKAAWSEAARSDPDALNLDEFLSFRHPESSHSTILNKMQDLMDRLDMDGDLELTVEEFIDITPDEIGSKLSLEKLKEERRREFKEDVDKDKNGKVDRKELLIWMDPRNPQLAVKEARYLFEVADSNHDKFLTRDEVIKKASAFISSKMINTATSFHDEFK